jgi:hypothetical protein
MLCPDETFEGKLNSTFQSWHLPTPQNSQPINKNHLQGSKMLINFCDSSFANGEKPPRTFRYLKQIKKQNTETSLAENVKLCRINKPV